MNNIETQKFLGDMASHPNIAVYKTYASRMNLGDVSYTRDYVIQTLSNCEVGQLKDVSYAITTLKAYMKWYADGDNRLIEKTDEIFKLVRRRFVLDIAKENKSYKKKYISHADYLLALKNIDDKVEYNHVYMMALFASIYNGIYCDDMSVLRRLRRSDISDGFANLSSDNGEEWRIPISKELQELLDSVSKIYKYRQLGRYNDTYRDMEGEYYDSCFKLVHRNRTGNEDRIKQARQTYMNSLRKTCDTIDIDIKPMSLFVSGMVYRISEKLNKIGVSLDDAFSKYQRNPVVLSIIDDECRTYNCDLTTSQFMEKVAGSLEDFY